MYYASVLIANFLLQRQAVLYTYPGGTIAPLYHECKRAQVPIVRGRTEQGAGYMAIGEAQLNGRASFVAVTSGPGATNLVTCIADAWYDSVPLVAMTGQVGVADLDRSPQLRQRGFQEVPVSELMRSICKRVFQPRSVDELAEAIVAAVQLSEEGRPGPVVIDLPMSVQLQELEVLPELPLVKTQDSSFQEELQLKPVVKALEQAKHPLLLVGAGAKNSCVEVRDLIERWNLPVVSSVRGLGVVPGSDSRCFGWVGHTGFPWANWAMEKADLLLVLGSRLDVRQTGTLLELFDEKKIIHVDLDPAELQHGRLNNVMRINAKVQQFVTQLLRHTSGDVPFRQAWFADLNNARQRLPLQDYGIKAGVAPDALLGLIDSITEGQSLVVTSGVGSHQQWVARYLTFNFPDRQLFASAGHGTMGYSLPAALGIQRIQPDRLVLSVDGDGSFQMNLQELAVLKELQLPVKILLLDNQRLGIVSQFQQYTFNDDPVTGDFPTPDFTAIARAYGLVAWEMKQLDERLLRQWLEHDGPSLLHVRIQHDAPVSPMLMGGQSPGNMWYQYRAEGDNE